MRTGDNNFELEHMVSDFCTAPFCIYGAGIVATSIYTVIKTLYQKTPLFFLVSDAAEGKMDENPLEIDGIPVKRLSEWQRELWGTREMQKPQNVPAQDTSNASGSAVHPTYYLVVVPETHHVAITASLHSLHIEDSQICLFTGTLENQFMETYYSSLPDCYTVNNLIGVPEQTEDVDAALSCQSEISSANPADIQVFQAKCHVDRALQHPGQNPFYVEPIQVGADLTDLIISELRDNTGENISDKNRNYCELTATYYAWRNCQAAYKGLCHYRRIFEIDNEQVRILLDKKEDWDVILPYPSIHYPDISTQHIRYIKDADWQAMLQALAETALDYFEAYQKLIESGEQYFFNYNMLIARAEVFDDYCSFLFSVLERAEALTAPKGWERADRFAGYMGENLTTLYFLKNRDKLKIVYAGKKWLT